MRKFPFILLMMSCASLFAQDVDALLLEVLKTHSPFGKPPEEIKHVAKSKDANELQLQGIAYVEGAWLFSVTDVKNKTSSWLKLGETKNGITAESYDPKEGVLNVNMDSKNYELSVQSRESLPTNITPAPVVQTSVSQQGGERRPRWGRGGWERMSVDERKNAIEFAKRRLADAEARLQEDGQAQPQADR